MKQGNSVITLAIALLAAALAAYLGYYAWNTFNTPYTTTVAYAYVNNDSAEGDGLLVRQEQVLPAQSGIVELTRSEGEKVAAGKTVALVYANGEAQTRPNPAGGAGAGAPGAGVRRPGGRGRVLCRPAG